MKTASAVAAVLAIIAPLVPMVALYLLAYRGQDLIGHCGLPDASGLDLMRQIRDRFGTPGIALSGYGMEEDIENSRDAGFLDHLVKPINVEHLKATIHRIVSRPAAP